MNVASLELSKELYELSGWEDLWYIKGEDDAEPWVHERRAAVSGYETLAPAYSLGFLLRKFRDSGVAVAIGHGVGFSTATRVGFDVRPSGCEAEESEDAATKLAIELFKRGVLTRGGDE